MENNIIVVFNNRNKSMQFASYLKRMGIPNKTVNTPRELSVSCGISVIFNGRYLSKVKELLVRLNFGGKFYIVSNHQNKKYTPIYNIWLWHLIIYMI